MENTIFKFEIDEASWLSENEGIDITDLDYDTFLTELAYSNFYIQEPQNPAKKIELKNVEMCYIITKLEFLVGKFEKNNDKEKKYILSMHQNFNLEVWYENKKMWLLDNDAFLESLPLIFDLEVLKNEIINLKKEVRIYLEKYYPNFKNIWEKF